MRCLIKGLRQAKNHPRFLWQFSVYILSFALLTGCASQFKMVPIDTPSDIYEKQQIITSTDSSFSIMGREIAFPGKVTAYDYHHPTRTLLVKYSQNNGKRLKAERRFILYDLDKQQTRWAAKGNPEIGTLRAKTAILDFKGHDKIMDAADGHFLRDAEEADFWLYIEGDDVLALSKDKYARFNLFTGEEIWQRPGQECTGYRWVSVYGDSIYVVANGLQAVDMNTGDGWGFLTSTSSKAVGKEVAKHVVNAFLDVLTRTRSTPSWDPDLTHNLCSYPLVIDDRVYFGARNKMFCFSKATGRVLWQVTLEKEPGSMIVRPAGSYIALISEGWKYKNYKIQKAVSPLVVLVNKTSGEPVARFSTDTSDVVLDFRWADNNSYLLTSTHLYRLDHNLSLVGILNTSPEWGPFIRILDASESLAMRTLNGLVVLEPTSLDVLSYKSLGGEKLTSLRSGSVDWYESTNVLMIKNSEVDRSWHQQGIHYLASATGLTGIDLKNKAKTVVEIPISGNKFEVSNQGVLITLEENIVSIFNLNEIGQRQNPQFSKKK